MSAIDKQGRLEEEAALAAEEAAKAAERLDPVFPWKVMTFDAVFWLL